ncbi:hypothetical protein KIPB_015094, partial [Kipferlia bialata]|eukprot:g15094.t1
MTEPSRIDVFTCFHLFSPVLPAKSLLRVGLASVRSLGSMSHSANSMDPERVQIQLLNSRVRRLEIDRQAAAIGNPQVDALLTRSRRQDEMIRTHEQQYAELLTRSQGQAETIQTQKQ